MCNVRTLAQVLREASGRVRTRYEIGATEVDDLVLELVRSIAVDNLAQIPQGTPSDDSGALETEMKDLARLFGEGLITTTEWLAAREPLARRLAGAKPATRVDAAALLARYDGLTIAELRSVVREIVEKVTILPTVGGRNFFDRQRVVVTLRLGGIAVP